MHNKILTPFVKVPRQIIYTPQIKKPNQNIEFNEGIIMQNIEFRLSILFWIHIHVNLKLEKGS